MTSQNYYPGHFDHNLKRSFISQPFNNSNLPNQILQNRTSTSKRTSLTMIENLHNPVIDHPKTPKANPNHMQPNLNNFSMAGHYFHQSSYVNHSYQIPPPPSTQFNTSRAESQANKSEISTSRVDPVNNKIEAFSLEQKKIQSIQQMMKQLNEKVEKIIKKVQIHEKIMKNNQSQNKNNHQQNVIPPLNNQFIVKIIQETINDYNQVKQIETNMHQKMIKNQIESIKQNLNSFINTKDVDDRIKKIGASINKQIQNVNRQLKDSLSNLIENQRKDRKKDIQKLKVDLEQQILFSNKNLQQKIKILREKDQSDKLTSSSSMQNGWSPSKKIFLGDPILIKYATKVAVTIRQCTKELQDMQTVYKIDKEGYLLDSEGRYIINNKYQQVKLSEDQLELIRQKGFLK